MASHSDLTTMQAQKAIGKVDDFLASKTNNLSNLQTCRLEFSRRLFCVYGFDTQLAGPNSRLKAVN